MASSAPSTERRLLEEHRLGHVVLERADLDLDEIADLEQFRGRRRRVHAKPARGNSTWCAPMRTRAFPCSLAGHVHHDRRDDVAGVHRARPPIRREALQRVTFGQDVARRTAVAAAALVDPAQSAVERGVRGLLQLGVERRLHAQPRFVQRLGAILLLELLADVLHEVGRDRAIGASAVRRATSGRALAARPSSAEMNPSSAMRCSTYCCAASASVAGRRTGSAAQAPG